MSDVRRVVETVFTTVDNVTSPLTVIASVAQRAGSALSGMVTPLTSIVAGVASLGTLRGIMGMQSAAEGTQLAITGTLRAFDAAGESMEDINRRFTAGTAEWNAAQHRAFMQAQGTAQSVLAEIQRSSAALPGSAEDYVEVYRTALPAALQAGMTDVMAIAHFTNDMAATAAANQIDAAQAARDTSQMLHGHADSMNRTFTALSPLMGKTAQQFNQMSSTARVAAMQSALQRYRPLLNEFNTTWDAIYGTTEATIKAMARGATTPIFDYVKDAFKFMNEWLERNQEQLTRLGNAVSHYLVDRFDAAIERVVELRGELQDMGQQIAGSRWFKNLYLTAGQLGGAATRLAHNPSVQMAAGGAAARVAMGPAGALVGPMLAFATHGKEASATLDNLTMVARSLVPVLEPMIGLVGLVNDTFGDLLAGVLPGLTGGLAIVAEGAAQAANAVMGVYGVIMLQLRPHLAGLGGALGHLAHSIGEILGPALRIVGAGFVWLYNEAVAPLIPAFTGLIDVMTRFVHWLAEKFSWVGHQLGRAADFVAPRHAPAAGANPLAGPLAGLTAALQRSTQAAGANEQATAAATNAHRRQTPAARAGHGTYNDFRNSRFDVTQRFAEGFDPDRVAVAFAEDLEQLANQQLQSGLAPVFGVT